MIPSFSPTFIVAVVASLLVLLCLYLVFRSPFHCPRFKRSFVVTGKRNPDVEFQVEVFINWGGFAEIEAHWTKIEAWRRQSERRWKKALMRNYRRRQYERALEDDRVYVFSITRTRKRSRRSGGARTSYKETKVVGEQAFSYDELYDLYKELEAIGFATTLRQHERAEVRRQMTWELRRKIKLRDNYTCQECGKYMPGGIAEDGTRLHIDHIIPVSKGGQSVEENLQVLCEKCNRRKSDHLDPKFSLGANKSRQ